MRLSSSRADSFRFPTAFDDEWLSDVSIGGELRWIPAIACGCRRYDFLEGAVRPLRETSCLIRFREPEGMAEVVDERRPFRCINVVLTFDEVVRGMHTKNFHFNRHATANFVEPAAFRLMEPVHPRSMCIGHSAARAGLTTSLASGVRVTRRFGLGKVFSYVLADRDAIVLAWRRS